MLARRGRRKEREMAKEMEKKMEKGSNKEKEGKGYLHKTFPPL